MLKLDWNILFTLINLVIFYLLMKRFLFKPILKVMNERKEMINNQMQQAEDAKNDAFDLKKQYENKLRSADEESSRIINEAKQTAKTEYGRILDKAGEDAEKMKENARRQIIEEGERAKRSAREDIASLAMQAAERLQHLLWKQHKRLSVKVPALKLTVICMINF